MTETRSTSRRSTRQRSTTSKFASFMRTKGDKVVSLEDSRKAAVASKKRQRTPSPMRSHRKASRAANSKVLAEANAQESHRDTKLPHRIKISNSTSTQMHHGGSAQIDKRQVKGRRKDQKEDIYPASPSTCVMKPATPSQGSFTNHAGTHAWKPSPASKTAANDVNSGVPANTPAAKNGKAHSARSTPELAATRPSPATQPITPSPAVPANAIKTTNTPSPQSKKELQLDWFDPLDDEVVKAAKLAFQASAGACAPTLMCRDEQQQQLAGIVASHLSDSVGGSIYVSGLPGTGKSLTCSKVLRVCPAWAATSAQQGRPLLLWVNCMSLEHPRQIFQRVLDGIQVAGAMSQQQYNENPVAIPTNSEGAAGDAREKLQKLLCHQQSSRKGSRSGMVVLVLDELDSLQTGDQSTLTDLFLLTAAARSRLVLIGISNSIDLTERTLPHLKAAGMTPTLVPFPAYGQKSLLAILKQREEMLPGPVFAHKAMEFAARKVGSGSGDMRQLLQAARCAIDALAEDSKDGVVKEVPPSNGPDLQPSNDLSAGVSLGAGGNSAARPTSLVGIRHMAAGVAQLQGSCGVAGAVNSIRNLSREQQTVLCAAANILHREANNSAVGAEGHSEGLHRGKAKNIFTTFNRRKPWFPSKTQKSGVASEGSSGMGCTVAALHDMYLKLSRESQIPAMHTLEFSSVCRNLSDLALLQIGPGKNERQRRVSLKISTEDILMALQHVSLFRRMLSFL